MVSKRSIKMKNIATSSILLWTATVISFLGFIAHAFFGGSMFVQPLMSNTDLPLAVIWLGFVSWHVVSVVLLTLAITFGYTVTHPENKTLTVFASAMSAAVSILCISVGIFGNAVILTLPAPYLFCIIAVLGVAGFFTSKADRAGT